MRGTLDTSSTRALVLTLSAVALKGWKYLERRGSVRTGYSNIGGCFVDLVRVIVVFIIIAEVIFTVRQKGSKPQL